MWVNGSVPLKIPKCYFNQEILSDQVGFLILQDFSDILAQPAIGQGLTVNQLMQVGENLGNLHAWSLSNQGWQDKFKHMGKRMCERVPNAAKVMFDSIKEVMPEDIDPAKLDVVLEHCKSLEDIWYIVTIHEEFKMPPVLVHGDLWCGNMMFRKKIDKDGNVSVSDELLTIFDWQVNVSLLTQIQCSYTLSLFTASDRTIHKSILQSESI